MGWGDRYRGWGNRQPAMPGAENAPMMVDPMGGMTMGNPMGPPGTATLPNLNQSVRDAFGNGGNATPSGSYSNPYIGWGSRRSPVQNPFLNNPQSGAGEMNDPNAMTPSSYARPSFRQAEVASMDAYKKLQSAGGLSNPVKAQAPTQGGNAGFYYLDDGQGNMRPYGYSSSPPMIPGYNAVLDPNGQQTFGDPAQPQGQAMAQAPQQQPTLRLEGQPDPNENFFSKLLRGFTP